MIARHVIQIEIIVLNITIYATFNSLFPLLLEFYLLNAFSSPLSLVLPILNISRVDAAMTPPLFFEKQDNKNIDGFIPYQDIKAEPN